MYETIDALQGHEDYYFIDFIPYNTDDSKFLELENYFLRTYLNLFSSKIIRIALKLIFYYPCKVFLTEPERPYQEKCVLPFDTDVRNSSPESIASAIEDVILNDFSSVQILFTDPQFLISIGGEFSVTVYDAPQNILHLIEQLCTQEGLFLKSNESR